MDLIYRTFQFYRPYLTNEGELLNIWGPINNMLIEVPFFILNFLVMAFCVVLDLLDQSSSFIAQQDTVYNLGKKIFNEFGGTALAKGSLISLFVIFSGIYLGYHFLAKNGQFTKKLIHYFAVVLIMFMWFAPIKTTNGSTQSGGLFIMKTVNTVCTQVKEKATSVSFSIKGQDEDMSPEKLGFTKMYYQETIGRTFMYLNSGSYDGVLPNGKKLDVDKLIPNKKIADSVPEGGVGLWDSLFAMIAGDENQKEAVKWAKERQKYINETAKTNSFMALSGDTIAYKLIATGIAIGDSIVLGFPVAYVNLMLSIIQLLILVVLFLMPVIILVSFVPALQNVLFKVCKMGVGLLFAPVLLTLFLIVFFALIRMINLGVQTGIDALPNAVVVALLATGSGGLMIGFLLLLLKFGVLRTFWKNKDNLMNLITDGKYKAIAELEQRVKDKVSETTDKVVGGAEVALGMYTGNAQLAMDGAGRLTSDAQGNSAYLVDVGREHFVDDEANQFRSFSEGMESWKQAKGFGNDRMLEEDEENIEDETPSYEEVSLEPSDGKYDDEYDSSYSEVDVDQLEQPDLSIETQELNSEIEEAPNFDGYDEEEQGQDTYTESDQPDNQENFEVGEVEQEREQKLPEEQSNIEDEPEEHNSFFEETSTYETMEAEELEKSEEDIFN